MHSLSRASDHKRRKIEDASLQGRLLGLLIFAAVPLPLTLTLLDLPALLVVNQYVIIILILMLIASILD